VGDEDMPPYAVTGRSTPCCPYEGGVGRCDMAEKIVLFMRGGGVLCLRYAAPAPS